MVGIETLLARNKLWHGLDLGTETETEYTTKPKLNKRERIRS